MTSTTLGYKKCLDKRGAVQFGFTLVEVLVVIAIIGILAGILFPVFAKSREQARKAVCQSNLKQIWMALMLYVGDYDEMLPNNQDPKLWMGRFWRPVLEPYIAPKLKENPQILYCPSDSVAPNKWESSSYGLSHTIYHTAEQINEGSGSSPYWSDEPCISQSLAEVKYPAQKAVAAEWLNNHEPSDPAAPDYYNGHFGWRDWRGSRNYLFADGHVKYLKVSSILPAVDGTPDINWTIDGLAGRDMQ